MGKEKVAAIPAMASLVPPGPSAASPRLLPVVMPSVWPSPTLHHINHSYQGLELLEKLVDGIRFQSNFWLMHHARLGCGGMVIGWWLDQPRYCCIKMSGGYSLAPCHDSNLCFFQKMGKALPLLSIC